ncbi:protein BIG GRAIN 1-like A [Pyrus x bretschneideri]|uniref:protein BIG GRAIN 1-like A n=1 Tax=Pyrus x bretschneideri TaxID=225117 RepID=UPI00202FD4AD|nr:protein BIG GRAIN 1-like A [Pyrus x bretschneideri]
MSRWENKLREDRYRHEKKNPSFSSSLLEKIYRSIDEGSPKNREDPVFYNETMPKKQSKSGAKSGRVVEEEEMASLRRACLIEKWMEMKVGQKVGGQRRQHLGDLDRKLDRDHQRDLDAMFFSSTSSSSDSSSGGFSSSDAESMFGSKSRSSCFAPPRPKPVRTSVSTRSAKSEEKTERKHRTLFYEQREVHLFDDYHYSCASDPTPKLDEGIIKSKSRALKIYSNLKKVKQPLSPGGRVANFLNSIFTAGQTKKTKSTSSIGGYEEAVAERKLKSWQDSTCSSASSFSRSCLSKNSPSTREKLRNGVKRSVHFSPVSVIVDEDCRPCGHKCLYEGEDKTLMPVTVPTAWKIGRSPARKAEEELKLQVLEKSRRVEEAAREILRDCRRNQVKNELVSSDCRDGDEGDDDDAASCSSSDLFELDHLSVIGKERYLEELPVYETTHVRTNRAIANGLIM